jgi:hypothetical protein
MKKYKMTNNYLQNILNTKHLTILFIWPPSLYVSNTTVRSDDTLLANGLLCASSSGTPSIVHDTSNSKPTLNDGNSNEQLNLTSP